jgi:asparagine synthase (glutamine-hydrolysing)
MCGVAAVLGPLPVAPREALVAAMCARLAHRGPDGAGLFSSPADGEGARAAVGVTLGHRRLAIVDLSTDAAQPMQRGGLALAWNGEIYNYQEIRAELRARGHHFTTASDTEVLLSALAEYGPAAALPQLNGMFAFVLWDAAARRLWLGRDRFGKKPLYYLQHGDTLVVASEPKAILAAARTLGLPVSVERTALARYLADADTEVDEVTFFAEIRRVRPGELICFTPGAAGASTLVAQRHVYYTLRPPAPLVLSAPEAAERFAALLSDAVRLRLRSDVPVGAALSGGMDSSALVGVASQLGARLDTFSAVYRDDDPMDERRYIAAVVAHTGVANYQVAPETELTRDGLSGPDGFTAFINHHDEPVGGASVWAQRCVFRLAAAHGVRVVLSGQGADESLTGYRGALSTLTAELIRRGDLRALHKELLAQAQTQTPQTLLRDLLGGAWTAARTFALPAALSSEWLHLRWQHALRDTRFFHLHALPLPPVPEPGPYHQAFCERSLLHGYLYRLLTGSSLRTILRYEDRNSMAASVESRAPFLDYRLVELCLALPATTLCQDGRTKALLRQALHGVLPPAVAERRDKVGFATPEARLMLGPLRPLVLELLGSPAMEQRGLYDCAALRRMYADAAAGRGALDSYALWKALNVELWLRNCGLSL